MTEEVFKELRKFNEVNRDLALWYLSCPYWHDDPTVRENRIDLLGQCYRHIVLEFDGVVPFAPVLDTTGIQAKLRIHSHPKAGMHSIWSM